MELNPEAASRTIELVYAETGFRAIVCDSSGTIIAEIDKERIGTVHSGACRILREGLHEVIITPEEEVQSAGVVKIGVSLPIFVHGALVGTYGIGGPTEQVRSVARISVGLIRNALEEEQARRRMEETEQRLQSLFSICQKEWRCTKLFWVIREHR